MYRIEVWLVTKITLKVNKFEFWVKDKRNFLPKHLKSSYIRSIKYNHISSLNQISQICTIKQQYSGFIFNYTKPIKQLQIKIQE